MVRGKHKLTAKAANTTKRGRYGDGGGLYLVVSGPDARKWVFRFTLNRKVNEMGLGSASAVSLAAARAKADEARKCVARGESPIEQRRGATKAAAGKPTFGQCADDLIKALQGGWRNAKHRQQWGNTLRDHAAKLRTAPVDAITTEDVLGVLKPIWQLKPETASRVRARIEAVLDAARANGHISENTANPARWRGHLDKLLSKRQKLARGHHAAMSFGDVPEFLDQLRHRKAIAALLLEFIILTAARLGEARGTRWTEIDMAARVWIVPAARMKGGREHRVPLSARAAQILEALAEAKLGDFVFPGNRPDRPLSDTITDMLLRRMKAGVTTHGFRSSFRDWAGECTSFPREIAEAALAHAVGNEVERAYRRSDALEKRRKLMEAWASYCTKSQGANVLKPKFGKAP
jgi:integrase